MKTFKFSVPTPSDVKHVASNYYAGVKARRQAKRDERDARKAAMSAVAAEIVRRTREQQS